VLRTVDIWRHHHAVVYMGSKHAGAHWQHSPREQWRLDDDCGKVRFVGADTRFQRRQQWTLSHVRPPMPFTLQHACHLTSLLGTV